MKLRLGRPFVRALRDERYRAAAPGSPFERNRVWDPDPDLTALGYAFSKLVDCFPQLEGTRIAESWAGMIDITPDAVPVISSVSPGLFLATGFSGHGFGIGPGAGKLAADLITANETDVDPAPFQFSRLSGSRISDDFTKF